MSKKNKEKTLEVRKRPSKVNAEKFKEEQAKRLEVILKKMQKRGILPKHSKRWRNVQTTLILLFILSFSVLSVVAVCYLDYFISDTMAPTSRYGLLAIFAVFMQIFSVVIWDDLFEMIDADYFFKPLLYVGFWGFLISGVITYVIYMVFAVGQWLWWSPSDFFGVLPALFGTLVLASFVYKVVNIFDEN